MKDENKPILEWEKYPSDECIVRVEDDGVNKQDTKYSTWITSESE